MNLFFKYFSVIFIVACSSQPVREEVVPKELYDELLEKYQRLQMQGKPSEKIEVPKLQEKKEVSKIEEVRIENESLTKLEEAKNYIDQGDYDSALSILRPLTQMSNQQVAVQAKFLTGEMLYFQKEYDLAMQIYEEILKENAFSGLVINCLERLIDCCDKLKLTQKREQYRSLLNDVFTKE